MPRQRTFSNADKTLVPRSKSCLRDQNTSLPGHDDGNLGNSALRRAHTMSLDLELESQQIPISLDPSSPRFEDDMRLLCARWQVPQKLQKLYLATCTNCVPKLDSYTKSYPEYLARTTVQIATLRHDCVICNAIQQTHHRIFGPNDSGRKWAMINYGQDSDHLQVDFLDDPELSGRDKDEIRVQLYSKEPRNPCNPFPVASADICSDILAPAMLTKTQGWIQECVQNHDRCTVSATKGAFVPKRLIKLGSTEHIVELQHPVRYAALSYCWGPYRQHVTTADNLSSRLSNLEQHQLPRTLQDAILMARSLGLQYLWIDSICIIQDDQDDWAQEAATMADIYSNAHVVLAATAAKDVAQGFIHSRKQYPAVQLAADSAQPITVNIRMVNNHNVYEFDGAFGECPLSKRGWALQERSLATRTLHFLPDEVVFECKSSLACECGYSSDRDRDVFSYMSWPPEARDFKGYTPPEVDFPTYWMMLVRLFKSRSLTYEDDALPALSGMAQRSLPLKPGKYFAGLWEQNIAFQLSWGAMDPRSTLLAGKMKRKGSRPTFSWVSCPVSVICYTDGELDRPICTLISGHSVLASSDIYGQVERASLRMRGRVMRGLDVVCKIVSAKPLELTGQDEGFTRLTVILDAGQQFPLHVYPYGDPVPPRETWYEKLYTACEWSTVVCLGLSVSEHDTLAMLLLQPLPEQTAFIRIGLVTNFPRRWFDPLAIEQTVDIS